MVVMVDVHVKAEDEMEAPYGLAPKPTGIQAPGHAHEDRQGTWETSHLPSREPGEKPAIKLRPAQDVSLRVEQRQRRQKVEPIERRGSDARWDARSRSLPQYRGSEGTEPKG